VGLMGELWSERVGLGCGWSEDSGVGGYLAEFLQARRGAVPLYVMDMGRMGIAPLGLGRRGWLADRGVAMALCAHPRGGEMGDAWHDAAR